MRTLPGDIEARAHLWAAPLVAPLAAVAIALVCVTLGSAIVPHGLVMPMTSAVMALGALVCAVVAWLSGNAVLRTGAGIFALMSAAAAIIGDPDEVARLL